VCSFFVVPHWFFPLYPWLSKTTATLREMQRKKSSRNKQACRHITTKCIAHCFDDCRLSCSTAAVAKWGLVIWRGETGKKHFIYLHFTPHAYSVSERNDALNFLTVWDSPRHPQCVSAFCPSTNRCIWPLSDHCQPTIAAITLCSLVGFVCVLHFPAVCLRFRLS